MPSKVPIFYSQTDRILKSYCAQTVTKITYDTDAQAFFTALETGGDTLTITQKYAVNNLVINLKYNGIWDKCIAIYPFIGGTATAHAWNLKSTSLYKLTFVGSPTHDAQGTDWNGSTQYATTGWTDGNRGIVTSPLNFHFSIYNNDATPAPAYEPVGFYGINDPSYCGIILGFGFSGGDVYQIDQAYTGAAYTQYVPPRNQGFRIITRNTNNDFKSYFQGTQSTTDSRTVTVTAFNGELYLGARNANGLREYSTQRTCFSSLGIGLTAVDVTNFNAAVDAFQNSIGRSI